MNYQKPQITPFGKQAVLIAWEEKIDEKLLYFILEVKQNIEKITLKEKVEVINTYNSLLIKYDLTIKDFYDEISMLEALILDTKVTSSAPTTRYILPVCYDTKFGIDLEELSRKNKLDISTIISLHTRPDYTVFFIGFLPGFLYLGGLDEKLFISRKKTPRLSVEKGAVGIGEKQTGIYPQNSAGGWQIIGNCPINFFDVSYEKPTPFQLGDKLKFEAVSLEAYEELKHQISTGNYQFKKENYVR